MKEFENYDGLGLAELVRSGEISAVELLDASIERVERRNSTINAVNFKLYDMARQRIAAGLPEGPFHGVPFLVKDLGAQFAGFPHSKGCRALLDHVSATDSELARRFIATGLVPFGKTNAPEFGLTGVTEPELHGPTRTPWDTARSAGGSSGGSAAAVSAGFAPIASAGDGGGSIRIPASCCGIFGLKPSRGRTPCGPAAEGWQGAVVEHILSRSVRDCAVMLDAVQGSDPGAPFAISPPERPYVDEIEREPGPLRVAFNTASPVGTPVENECLAAVEHVAHLLTDLGHHVEQATPEYDGLSLARGYFILYFGEVAAELAELSRILERPVKRDDVEATTWTLGLLGHVFSAYEFAEARQRWNDFARAMGRFHQDFDLYLTPTLAELPPPIGATKPSLVDRLLMQTVNYLGAGRLLKATGIVEKLAIESMSRMPFTQLANMTGQPAMNLPMFWTPDDLPVGVQFVAANGREDQLFQLAAQLERAQPWIQRRPPNLG